MVEMTFLIDSVTLAAIGVSFGVGDEGVTGVTIFARVVKIADCFHFYVLDERKKLNHNSYPINFIEIVKEIQQHGLS